MGRTTDLRRALKEKFFPLLLDKGFVLDMRHAPQFITFRKIAPDKIYICDVQWDKSGKPRFVINFGCGKMEEMHVDEKPLDANDLFPYHTPVMGRLHPSKGLGWFRQDYGLLKRLLLGKAYAPSDQIVSALIERFVEVEKYWDTGRRGSHIRILRG